MRKLTIYSFLFIALSVAGSCKKFGTLQVDPNAPSPENADVDLYLNNIQLNFANFFTSYNGTTPLGASDFSGQLVRMTVFYGPTYTNGYSPQTLDALWTNAYAGILKNANAMIPLAKQQSMYYHAGIAEVLKAYTLFSLVDLLGDVPYAEAALGNENLNPGVQSGRAVYDSALLLLDSAISDFGKTSASSPTTILYSNASKASWIRVANTLKLKAYITTRLVDNTVGPKIQALVDAGNLIDADNEEFTFKYGTQQSTPNSRHPLYNLNYTASGGAGGYIGTQFMYSVRFEKGFADPRTRYYFYRQTLGTPGSQQQQPCAYNTVPAHYTENMPFCVLNAGYWGRDHADNSGIPPDGTLRTVPGVYPAGGKFDCSEGVSVGLNEGGRGAGIAPIWMSFFTDFTLAEAALTTTGFTGDARTLLQSGVTKSINRVMAFATEVGVTPCTTAMPTEAAVTNYISYVVAEYDAATTADAKLDVILREYYIALWGNGMEAYNMYRRTSRPVNLQLPIQANAGTFIRSFLYPSVYVNLNSNAQQKSGMDVKVFWDANPNPLF